MKRSFYFIVRIKNTPELRVFDLSIDDPDFVNNYPQGESTRENFFGLYCKEKMQEQKDAFTNNGQEFMMFNQFDWAVLRESINVVESIEFGG
jgi:hypothetical protein